VLAIGGEGKEEQREQDQQTHGLVSWEFKTVVRKLRIA
jgi:hypothetical protein